MIDDKMYVYELQVTFHSRFLLLASFRELSFVNFRSLHQSNVDTSEIHSWPDEANVNSRKFAVSNKNQSKTQMKI